MNKPNNTTLNFEEQKMLSTEKNDQPAADWLSTYAETGSFAEAMKTKQGIDSMVLSFALKFRIPQEHRDIIKPFFLQVIARGLNPMFHAYAYNFLLDKKDKTPEEIKAAWTLQISYHGYYYLASQLPGWKGVVVNFVNEGDTFEMKNNDGVISVNHSGNPFGKKVLLGAYAIATIGELKYFGYSKIEEAKTTGAWKENQRTMLGVRAITQCLSQVINVDIDALEETIPPEKQLPAAHEVPALPPGIEEVEVAGFELVDENTETVVSPVERLKNELKARGIEIPDPIAYLQEKTKGFDPDGLKKQEVFEACIDAIVRLQAKK